MKNSLDLYNKLKGKEAAVLALILRGMSQRSIADCFRVSQKTISKWYHRALTRIIGKKTYKDMFR